MRPWLPLILLLPLTGCGISDALKGERQHIYYYALSNSFEQAAAEPGSGHVALEPFTSEKAAMGLQFARRTDLKTIEYWVYPENHLWWASPPLLATDLSMHYLRRHFEQVSPHPGAPQADLVLSCRLLQFEEIRGDGQTQGTALALLSVVATPKDRSPVRFLVRGTAKITHQTGHSVDGSRIAAGLSQALTAALDQAAARIKSLP